MAGDPTSIGYGTVIRGELESQSDMRVDGEIHGDLTCHGKLIIGPKGLVDGRVICDNAIVQGKFSGSISVHESLEVQQSAEMKGEIFTKQLHVHAGAAFNVTCDMSGKQIKSFTRKEDEKGEVVSMVN